MNSNLISEKKDFTPEQLAAIEEMAAHGFTTWEIAEVLGDDRRDTGCMQSAFVNRKSEAYRYYRKGFLKSQLELRQRIFLDAKHGSSPAQTLAAKILDEAEYQMHE
jgi:hypothetical protein